MKYLIVGLGNPGDEYKNTRHNIGFMALDALAEASNVVFSPNRYADTAELKHKGRSFILAKPMTFMNLSGKAVNYWMQKEKVPIEKVMIITDDIALPFGKVRLRKKGSSGGHNGLRDIETVLGRTDYPRLRFGVGNEFHKGQQVSYVLSDFSDEERKILPERLELAGKMILAFGTLGIGRTMSEFNNK